MTRVFDVGLMRREKSTEVERRGQGSALLPVTEDPAIPGIGRTVGLTGDTGGGEMYGGEMLGGLYWGGGECGEGLDCPSPPNPQFSTAKGRKGGTDWKETLHSGSLTDSL